MILAKDVKALIPVKTLDNLSSWSPLSSRFRRWRKNTAFSVTLHRAVAKYDFI